MKPLLRIVRAIENEIAAFYELSNPVSAVDCLLSRDALAEALGGDTASINERGGVYLVSGGDDEVFVGINIGPSIEAVVVALDPETRLSNHNLDAFCVLVEEVSHFHLIVERMHRGMPLSKLELEWQGEVDKLLISAILLRRQSGFAHYHHLARCLFEGARTLEGVDKLYEEASQLAARFWYDLLSYHDGIADPAHSPTLKMLLKTAYSSRWQEKVAAIQKPTRRFA